MSPALMCALPFATAAACSRTVMLASAGENLPGRSGASRPPRSALTMSLRSAWRARSSPACSSATRRQALEEAYDVIAGRADEPAVERDALDLRFQERRALESATHHRLPLRRARGSRLSLAVDGEPVRIDLERHGLAQTDERVTCEPLAALDALEQKARLERL